MITAISVRLCLYILICSMPSRLLFHDDKGKCRLNFKQIIVLSRAEDCAGSIHA